MADENTDQTGAGNETTGDTGDSNNTQESQEWYGSLPEASHEKLKGFASIDDALGAIEQGTKHTHAKSADDFKLDGIFADAQLDDTAKATLKETLSGFTSHCMESDITPKQAEGLIKYQQELVVKQNEAAIEAGTTALKAQWGKDYDKNKDQSLLAVQALDKKMDGRLATALNGNPIVNDPMFIELMHTIGTMIGEDSLGIGSPGGAGDDKPMSYEEGFKGMFKKN